MSTQRKYPRVSINRKARVTLRGKVKSPEDCTLIDVSAEGVAVKVPNEKFAAMRGETLTVSMITGSKWVDIPGRVRYTFNTNADEVVIGVKLHLEVSGSATRQAWSRWVYRLLSAVRAPAPPPA